MAILNLRARSSSAVCKSYVFMWLPYQVAVMAILLAMCPFCEARIVGGCCHNVVIRVVMATELLLTGESTRNGSAYVLVSVMVRTSISRR